MRVLLINPPNQNEVTGTLPSFVTGHRGHNPPLGLLYVAAYLQKHTDHDIQVLDCQVEELNYDQLADRLRQAKPDVVGITTLTMALLDVLHSITTVKDILPESIVVLGGPHVHLYPEETIQLEGVDYLVQGEGEHTFQRLLENIGDDETLKNIPGLVFKSEHMIVNTGLSQPIANIDELPFPARKLVPYRKYTSILAKEAIVTTIFTSRGCPYGCTFCDQHHLGKKFRARSAKNVLNELEECVNMGIHSFLFYDDTFTIDRQRVIDICNGIIDRGFKIDWNIRTRVDTVDDQMLSYLKKAGCTGINYGVESGSDKILKELNKGITMEKVANTFRLTRKNGIPILAYFMIGNPGETINDIKTTFSVMQKLKPDYIHLSVLTPFPGTNLYGQALARNIIPNDCWQEFAQKPSCDFTMPHWGEFFSMSELSELLLKGYKGFYCTPSYIFRSMLKIRSFNEFKKKVSAGIRLLVSQKT